MEVTASKIVIPANDAGDYEVTVSDDVDLRKIGVKLNTASSKVSINGQNENAGETTLDVHVTGQRKLILPIKVISEDGTTHTYTLTLNIISSDNRVQKVLADGEECSLVDGVYKAYIDKFAKEVVIDITPKVEYSEVSHENEDGSIESDIGKLHFKVNTEDLDTENFTVKFKVTSEDGKEAEYEVILTRKSDDNTIHQAFVNNLELTPLTKHPIYANGTYYTTTYGNTAKVKIVANNEFAKVEFNGKSGINVLEDVVSLDPNTKICEIPVKITSQQGTSYETTIYIEKVSNDFSLEYIKVNNRVAIETDDPLIYVGYIYGTAETAKVEIKAKHELATVVRVTENGETWLDENGLSRTGTPTLNTDVLTSDEEETIFYFKIVAEDGTESEIYKVKLTDMSDDNSLKEVYVDGVLIEKNSEGKYVVNVRDNVKNVVVKGISTSELANVRVSFGEEALHIAESTIAIGDNITTVVPINVRSQSGNSKITYVYINKISDNSEIYVTVDGKDYNYYDEGTKTFTFMVDKTKSDFEMAVIAKSDYTKLEYKETEYIASVNDIVTLLPEEEGISLTIKTISEAGTINEYTVDIVHESDNVNLDFLKVDDIIREPDIPGGDTYTVMIAKDQTSALFEIQTEYKYAHLRLGDNNTVKHHDKGELNCSDLSQKQIVVPVVVTAADGKTIKTYNVVLVRDNSTYLMGRILTENYEGKHKSKVTLYKLGDPDEVIAEVDTNEDGTFKIRAYTEGKDHPDMLDAKYEVVITKKGYLNYTITDITLVPNTDMDLGEYNLIAGDVIGAGEIEIDDLVWFNRKFGYYINSEIDDSNKVYDFNEDGVVDQKDRDILVSNYGKLAEVVIWENPYEIQAMNLEDEAEFMLPVACNYSITSAYGTREDPITGEETVHAGIDLRVEHHTEILSVYDGEVTFSGVQKGYGNCVEIKHIIEGEEVYSFYAHMSRIDVKVGEEVKAGEVIGLEGGEPGVDENAGNSTGHHLHFEIRKEGSSSKDNYDPNDYLEF